MTTYQDLCDLRALHRSAEKLARKAESERNGNFTSELDQGLDELWQALRPKTNKKAVEVTEHFLLFLRSLFGQNKELTWRGDGDGLTDAQSSDIIIETVFAPKRRDLDLSKPQLILRPGPSNYSRIGIDNLKHKDMRTGAKTYTGLAPGTLQILCKARRPASAALLAEFVSEAIEVHRDELKFRVLHEISNVATGGYDPKNPYYNQGTDEERVAVVPVTLTYYYQWTVRKGPRPGVWEDAEALVAAFTRRLASEDPVPIDGRPEPEVKLPVDTILYAIPASEE